MSQPQQASSPQTAKPATLAGRAIAPEALRDQLRVLIDKHGMVGAASLLGVGRQALAALVGGLPVRRGTLTQAIVYLPTTK